MTASHELARATALLETADQLSAAAVALRDIGDELLAPGTYKPKGKVVFHPVELLDRDGCPIPSLLQIFFDHFFKDRPGFEAEGEVGLVKNVPDAGDDPGGVALLKSTASDQRPDQLVEKREGDKLAYAGSGGQSDH